MQLENKQTVLFSTIRSLKIFNKKTKLVEMNGKLHPSQSNKFHEILNYITHVKKWHKEAEITDQ